MKLRATFFRFAGTAVAVLVILLAATTVRAESLTVGYSAEISAADPHVLFGPNRNIHSHVYQSLLGSDSRQRAVPQLAVSWKLIDPTTWEFKLREGVRFHNGDILSAEDVKFSIERARDLDAPRTFRTYLRNVADVTVVDPTTIHITTKTPSAILLQNLSTFGILSKAAAEGAKEEDFNGGRAAIGTGPYKWIKWTPGETVELVRNDDYWGGKEPWEKVTFRFITNDSARVAALLAGDVDLIDAVPPSLLDRLEKDANIDVLSTTSYMLNYLHIDRHHASSLYIKDNSGKPMDNNPLNDVRVRKALALAVYRDAIAERVMGGQSTPAGQVVPEGMVGYDPSLKPYPFDPKKAKALLAEAGYPDGFQMAIHCTNDRYANDAKVCEALGQMFSAIGIKTEVQTLPRSVFFKRATSGGPDKEPEFSVFMVGFGTANGVADAGLTALLQTYNKKAGTGANNRGRYSNPEVDKLVNAAATETDDAKRMEMLSKATQIAMDEVGIIPIHHLNAIWAAKKGLTLETRTDGFVLAWTIRKS